MAALQAVLAGCALWTTFPHVYSREEQKTTLSSVSVPGSMASIHPSIHPHSVDFGI
ncbi:uncharacterized protein RCO7_15051 [Rhynchosporium graminicola]|uniref:Uncharacterized protein n=1 Tax=Rhynchosporium graminicola TaxID=2792576 RepID=A0A1E1LI02_9HELO|nr:uncharacterized protein RCO7_15051 [Rhynchosporium commune]